MTPRKYQQRHSKKPSQSNLNYSVQPSDYDSDMAPALTKTKMDLNLSVLRRYSPNIAEILSRAPSAVVYNFKPESENWELAEMRGTLFVCQLTAGLNSTTGGSNIVVLNRDSFDNLIVDMRDVQDVEIASDFLILRLAGGSGVEKVIGIYIHESSEGTRQLISTLVQDRWMKERVGKREAETHAHFSPAAQDGGFAGKSVSVNQLFGR